MFKIVRKIAVLVLSSFLLLLSACSDKGIHDSYAAYRDKTASQLYHTSKNDLQHGHYNRAVKKLEALNALYPFGAYAEQGSVNLIYAYYKNDDADEAQAAADRYLRLYPRGNYSDYAYYMKGVVAFQQGYTWLQRKAGVDRSLRDLSNLKDAYMSFNQLVVEFPESPYVPDAILRMRYIRNLYARHNLDLAQFYYDKRAYVAAANRAQEVVVHYDHSPSVVPALKIMIRSYRKLGLTTMADNTQKILSASYPKEARVK